MSKEQAGQRYHGIDALRGIAMILGIFLHVTIAYKEDVLPVWPHDANSHHIGFDYLYFFIHSFRMPLFFVIAGFFCRFLLLRVGAKEFMKRRWERIGIPFVASMILILPFTIFPFLYYKNSANFPDDFMGNAKFSLTQLFRWNGIGHLWFLYYLLLYYVIVLIYDLFKGYSWCQRLSEIVAENWKSFRNPMVVLFTGSFFGVWAILQLENSLMIPVDTGAIPGISNLLFYGFFMVIGWLIHMRSSIFELLIPKAWVLFVAGLLLSVPVFQFEHQPKEALIGTWPLSCIKLMLALQILLLVFGSMGLFLRYFIRENAFWRYLSDASYWMYLIHMGLVASLQIAFLEWEAGPLLKFISITLITLFFTLATYHFFVRFSIVGKYLHGKRSR